MKTFHVFILLMLFAGFGTRAQVLSDIPVSTDPDVRIGKLENGLVYYIRRNAKPENRIEMRLAVNAGSILETPGQLGLAHFTEHMCFNGTLNFPKNDLVDFLQKSGIKFGAGINAYTGFDETVYMLQIPADKPDLVEKGFQVLEDWAHQVTFDAREIDKERGVIVEEWRLGLGASDRMRKVYFPVILQGSRYADRLPIGEVEVIKNFKHDTLRQFYTDWYRPDLQAVIVVGDVDVDQVEKTIVSHFGGIKMPEKPRPRVFFGVPENEQPLVSVVTDREATGVSVSIYYKQPKAYVKTLEDYRFRVMQKLITGMLNQRLRELTELPDPAVNSAFSTYGGFIARTGDAFSLYAGVKEDRVLQALQQLLSELQRMKQFGFTAGELERQKEDLLRRYEKSAKEADKIESAVFAREYAANYLSGEPLPSKADEYGYVNRLLPGISLAEINKLAASWLTEKNNVVVITAPEKEGVVVPTNDQVVSALINARKMRLSPYVDTYTDKPLIDEKLPGGLIISRSFNKKDDYTEFNLTNGARVIIKTTAYRNDEILFSAFSFGGTSLYTDQDYISAMMAASIIDQSGIGNFNNIELEKKLKGVSVEISPYIDEIREGMKGKSSPRDLETLLQLTYLYFESPRKDTAAFRNYISRTLSQIRFMSSNPVSVFMDTLFRTSSCNHPRIFSIMTPEKLSTVNLDKAFGIYEDRFADVSDFTFVFVGNIHADSAAPLIEKYIGSITSLNRNETFRDPGIRFPEKTVNKKVYQGKDPKSMVGIMIRHSIDWNEQELLKMKMLKEIINIRVVEVIREQMSGVYSPRIQYSAKKLPSAEFSLMIMFGCSPKSAQKLTRAVLKVIADLHRKGPSEPDLGKVKELLIRERESESKTNRYWLSRIESELLNGSSQSSDADYISTVKNITAADLKKTALKNLSCESYVRIVLLPEK